MSATNPALKDPEYVITPEGFEVLQRDVLEREISVWPMRAWWPSAVGHPCDRYLVWRFNRHQQQKRHDYVLESIFKEGRMHQPSVYERLEKMGFEVIRESDRPTQWKVGNGAVLSAKIDGRVKAFKGQRYDPTVLMEIKGLAGWTWDKIETVEDIKKSEKHYVRGYYETGNVYLLLEGLPRGLWILKNKQTGLLKPIPYEINFDVAEKTIARVERLQLLVKDQVDPEPIPFDHDICGGCPFNHICYPPRSFGEGAGIIEDAALLEDLEQRATLEQGAKDHDRLDKAIKKKLKALVKAGSTVIVGPYIIEIKEVPKAAFTVAAHTEEHVKIKRLE